MIADTSSVLPTPQNEGSVQSTDPFTAGESRETGQAYQQPHEASTPEQPEHEAAPPSLNWDSPENPYRERLRRMQGSLQRQIEERRAAEHRAQQLEYQQVRQATQHLPPQQRQQALGQWQERQQIRQQQQRMQLYEQQLREREDAMERVATEFVKRELSQKYKVPVQELAAFRDPDSMEYHARVRANERRQQQRADRQARGSDRFEGDSLGGSTQTKRPTTFEEAERAFADLARRL